jgi:hypothetical protein
MSEQQPEQQFPNGNVANEGDAPQYPAPSQPAEPATGQNPLYAPGDDVPAAEPTAGTPLVVEPVPAGQETPYANNPNKHRDQPADPTEAGTTSGTGAYSASAPAGEQPGNVIGTSNTDPTPGSTRALAGTGPDRESGSATRATTETDPGCAMVAENQQAEPFQADEPRTLPSVPVPAWHHATSNETPPQKTGVVTAAGTHAGILVRFKDALAHLENFFARHPELRGYEAELKSNLATMEKHNAPAEPVSPATEERETA